MTDYRVARLLAKLEIPLLLAVPAVMAAALLAGVEQAALAMLVVVALVLALFFAGYEASRPGLRQIMPTLVLAALAAAGRILFGPIPDFKPVSAIAIIAGATLGRRNGFMVGALAALSSNFFFGQGMWTPWQMYAWGLVGYVGGALAHAGAFDRADGTVRMPALLTYGFASGLLYGVVINAYDIIGFVQPLTWAPCDLRVFGRPVQALVSPHQPSRREVRTVGLVAPGRESILPKCHFKTMPVYGARLAQADHAGYF